MTYDHMSHPKTDLKGGALEKEKQMVYFITSKYLWILMERSYSFTVDTDIFRLCRTVLLMEQKSSLLIASLLTAVHSFRF